MTASPWKRSRQARRQDPIAPVRKRRKRIAKKLAKRHGMQRVRGFSIERWLRVTRALGVAMGEALNRQAKRLVERHGLEGARVYLGVDMAKPGTRDRTVMADMGTPWHRGFWDEANKP